MAALLNSVSMGSGHSPSQTRLSVFFTAKPQTGSPKSKRAHSPVDLTGGDSDDDEPATKKPRKGGSFSRSDSVNVEKPGSSLSVFSHDPSQAASTSPAKTRTPGEIAAQKKRHEQFKRKLLEEKTHFLKRHSSIGSAEASTANLLPLAGSSKDVHPNLATASGSETESDDAFKRLTEMFASKSSSKGKGKAKAKIPSPKKKPVEIGPSGEEYTPLEKQVFSLHVSLAGK